MSADSAADDAVGADQHVDVEGGVYLQRGEDHHVKLIDGGGAVKGAGVGVAVDLVMVGVAAQRGGSLHVEVLHVQQRVDQPHLVQLHHLSGDAAEGKSRLHALLQHGVGEEAGHCQ